VHKDLQPILKQVFARLKMKIQMLIKIVMKKISIMMKAECQMSVLMQMLHKEIAANDLIHVSIIAIVMV
jgi:hypothetical protein